MKKYHSIYKFSNSLVHTNNELLLQKLRFTQKKYFKEPKYTNYFKNLRPDVEEFLFKFHCDHYRMNYEKKLEILRSVVKLRPNEIFQDILGIQEVIKSLSRELSVSSYADDDEFNIQQFVNIMHSIQYYDKTTWISAMDNYHKQGNLSWEEYKQFTNSVFHFSKLIDEEWQTNIIKDISQEAFHDFVGFLENSFTLNIDSEDLLQTYMNLRKFGPQTTANALHKVIGYYVQHLKNKENRNICPIAIQLLLKFIFDHTGKNELRQSLERLFCLIMTNINKEQNGFEQLHLLIFDTSSYINMLKLVQEHYFHNCLEDHITKDWSNAMFDMFINQKISSETYQSINSMIQLKFLITQIKSIFLEENQVSQMVVLIDSVAYRNLQEIKQRKQSIFSIINFYSTLNDVQQQDYLKILINSGMTVENVEYTNKELIDCLQDIDNGDMVYYMFDFIESVIGIVGQKIDSFTPEEWCFTYYMGYKYLVVQSQETQDQLDQNQQSPLQLHLNTLKQYIRLHYTTNYRRAIPLQSHYYKILSVVKLEEFMADDISNYF